MDTVNQPLAVVVDKPAINLCADADILPIVFLGAPEEMREIHRIGKIEKGCKVANPMSPELFGQE